VHDYEKPTASSARLPFYRDEHYYRAIFSLRCICSQDLLRFLGRSPAVAIAILSLFSVRPAISQILPEARYSIEVFKYEGSGERDKPGDILTHRFELLEQEVTSDYPGLSSKLKNLKIVQQSSKYPSGELVFWSRPPVLEVLGGVIVKSGDYISMESLVYLGELQGSLKSNPITINFDVRPKDFDSFKGLHGVLTLYALAMDAKARHEPKNVINDLLSEAKGLLPANAPNADKTEQQLLEAIEKEQSLNSK
jgi:hypothetical protein